MATRDFDGVDDDLRVAIGAMSAMTFGTVAAIVKRGQVGEYSQFFCPHTSGNVPRMAVGFNPSNALEWYTGASESAFGSVGNTTQWWLIVTRKPTGSSAPRTSIFNFTTGVWTHGAGGSIAAPTSPGVGAHVRFNYDSNEHFDGQIAARAAWSNLLPWAANTTGDAQIEAAGLEDGVAAWLAADPSALWLFNQAATTTPVEDLSADGTADQTSLVGTTVVLGDDPPGFSFTASEDHSGAGSAEQLQLAAGTGQGAPTFTQAGQTAALELNPGAGAGTPASADAGQSVVLELQAGPGVGQLNHDGTGQAVVLVLTAEPAPGAPAVTGEGAAASLLLAAGTGQGGADGDASGTGQPVRIELGAGNGIGTPGATGAGTAETIVLTAGPGIGSTDDSHAGAGLPSVLTLTARAAVGTSALSGTGATVVLIVAAGAGHGSIPGAAVWTMWDGTAEQPLTLDGVWDGAAIQPVTFDHIAT